MTGKADRIQELLNDPLMVEAWENTKQYLIGLFLDADSEDAAALQDIKRRIISLEAVKQDLILSVEDDRLEELRAIEDEESK